MTGPGDNPTDRFRRIDALFREALALPPEGRAGFLDDACDDDPELRDEVLALIEADEDAAASFLEATPHSQPGGAGPSPDLTGQTIGRYTIRAQIGAGGMGVVYEAQQQSPSRTVALKLIRHDSLSSAHRRRFEYEAELLGRLQHPGIARVYEAGTDDDGRAFIAMELIDGQPLTDTPPESDAELRSTLERMIAVCDAVHHAHQHGVIHRDLKPGNILVDRTGQPKILDFGVARDITASVDGATQHTRTGQLIGTLDYMSPEQAAGDPGAVDTRVDVYALGVILFRQLTGRLPHTLKDSSILDAVATIRDEPATRLGAVRHHLKGDLETIVAKALEKDKARRYASAAEFGADLRRFLNHEPILARPPSAAYQLRTFARRNKVAVAAALAIVGALAVATGISTRYAIVAQRAEQLAIDRADAADTARQEAVDAQRAAEDAREEAVTAQRAAENAREAEAAQRAIADQRVADLRRLANTFLFDIHDQIKTLPGAMRARELLVSTATQYLDILSAADSDDPVLRRELASGYMRIGTIQGLPNSTSLGQTTEGIASLTKARDLYRASAEDTPNDPRATLGVAATERIIAEILVATGEHEQAIDYFNSSLGWSQRTLERHPEDLFVTADLARAHSAIGGFWLNRSMPDEAIAALEESNVHLAKATGLAEATGNRRFLARLLRDRTITVNELGRAHGMRGDTAKQAANYDEALEIRERLLAANPRSARAQRDVLLSLSRVGNVRMSRGEYDAALERYQRALDIAITQADADTQNASARFDRSVAREKIGNALLAMGRANDALAQFQTANETRRGLMALDPANIDWGHGLATTLERAASAAAQLERDDEARSHWTESIQLCDQLLTRATQHAGTHTLLIVSNHKLAEHLLEQHDAGTACRHAQRAVELDDRMRSLGMTRVVSPTRDEIEQTRDRACPDDQPPAG